MTDYVQMIKEAIPEDALKGYLAARDKADKFDKRMEKAISAARKFIQIGDEPELTDWAREEQGRLHRARSEERNSLKNRVLGGFDEAFSQFLGESGAAVADSTINSSNDDQEDSHNSDDDNDNDKDETENEDDNRARKSDESEQAADGQGKPKVTSGDPLPDQSDPGQNGSTQSEAPARPDGDGDRDAAAEDSTKKNPEQFHIPDRPSDEELKNRKPSEGLTKAVKDYLEETAEKTFAILTQDAARFLDYNLEDLGLRLSSEQKMFNELVKEYENEIPSDQNGWVYQLAYICRKLEDYKYHYMARRDLGARLIAQSFFKIWDIIVGQRVVIKVNTTSKTRAELYDKLIARIWTAVKVFTLASGGATDIELRNCFADLSSSLARCIGIIFGGRWNDYTAARDHLALPKIKELVRKKGDPLRVCKIFTLDDVNHNLIVYCNYLIDAVKGAAETLECQFEQKRGEYFVKSSNMAGKTIEGGFYALFNRRINSEVGRTDSKFGQYVMGNLDPVEDGAPDKTGDCPSGSNDTTSDTTSADQPTVIQSGPQTKIWTEPATPQPGNDSLDQTERDEEPQSDPAAAADGLTDQPPADPASGNTKLSQAQERLLGDLFGVVRRMFKELNAESKPDEWGSALFSLVHIFKKHKDKLILLGLDRISEQLQFRAEPSTNPDYGEFLLTSHIWQIFNALCDRRHSPESGLTVFPAYLEVLYNYIVEVNRKYNLSKHRFAPGQYAREYIVPVSNRWKALAGVCIKNGPSAAKQRLEEEFAGLNPAKQTQGDENAIDSMANNNEAAANNGA